MAGVLPVHTPLSEAAEVPAGVDLVFRPDFKDDSLSASELELLGSVLPELIGELIQMAEDPEQE